MFTANDLLDLLPQLAERRPVFHSESDLQHELAWEIRSAHPRLRVRVESRLEGRTYLDLLVTDTGDDDRSLAVELKYPVRAWAGDHDGEQFMLRAGAQDVDSYDCVKDIVRLERLLDGHYAQEGLLLILSNDPNYWRPPTHGRTTNSDDFRLHDGVILEGSRAWGEKTGKGTMGRERVNPLALRGRYPLTWSDYSVLPGSTDPLRYLAISVEPQPDPSA